MNTHFATILRNAVTTAHNDRDALHAVANELHLELSGLLTETTIAPDWESAQEKDECVALLAHFHRAVRTVLLGTSVHRNGLRDEAWILLAGAARSVEAMRAIEPDTDLEALTRHAHQILDQIDSALVQTQASTLERHRIGRPHDGPEAATTALLADIRLHRTPQLFLDEIALDQRFGHIAWDLLTTASTHLSEHITDWEGVDDLTELTDAVHHARTLREHTFPTGDAPSR